MTQSAKQFLKDLRREVASHSAVNHLFLNRLATSPFSKQDYRIFADNHFALVCVFPSYLEALLLRATDVEVKLGLAKDLVAAYDEGAAGRDHTALYCDYLAAAGGDPTAARAQRLRPPSARFIKAHQRLARQRPLLEGLGAIGPGHRWALPSMFAAILPGLRRAGFAQEELRYFTQHLEHDDDHGRWLDDALERYAVDQTAQLEIRRGALLSLKARGEFWDGVQRELIRYRQPRAPRPDGPRPRPLLGEVLITAWDGFAPGKQVEDRARAWFAARRPTLAQVSARAPTLSRQRSA